MKFYNENERIRPPAGKKNRLSLVRRILLPHEGNSAGSLTRESSFGSEQSISSIGSKKPNNFVIDWEPIQLYHDPEQIVDHPDVLSIDSNLANTKIFDNAVRDYIQNNKNVLDRQKEIPTLVYEYTNEIFGYLSVLEIKYLPDPNYIMSPTSQLHPSLRSSLIDKLIQIHYRFGFQPEVLYLAVNLLDRFASTEEYDSNTILNYSSMTVPFKYHITAFTCLYMAAKYEETVWPSVDDYIATSGLRITKKQLVDIELIILQALRFDMGAPGPMNFLRRISTADSYDSSTRNLTKYIVETTLMDHTFMNERPSLVVAAAYFVSRKIKIELTNGPTLNLSSDVIWTSAFVYYSGYIASELTDTIIRLQNSLLTCVSRQSAVSRKYAQNSFDNASTKVMTWASQCI